MTEVCKQEILQIKDQGQKSSEVDPAVIESRVSTAVARLVFRGTVNRKGLGVGEMGLLITRGSKALLGKHRTHRPVPPGL